MTVRKLYGTLTWPPTLRVLASLYEHDLDFDFIPIDMEAGEHKREPFLSLSPFAEVPAFQDEELTLFESRAAMRFIAFAYPSQGKEHMFKDPLMQGVVAGWINVEDHQFDPPAMNLINELVFKPKNGFSPEMAVVAEEEAKLAKVLDIYERRLGESKYLGGEKLTSADLTNLPDLYYLMKTPARRLIESRPLVHAWCARIMATG